MTAFLIRKFHHRGTEFAEFGEFLHQNVFTPRLGGESSSRASPKSLKTEDGIVTAISM